MKTEEFCLLLSDIDETYVQQAYQPKRRPNYLRSVTAVAACLAGVLLVGTLLGPTGSQQGKESHLPKDLQLSFTGADASALDADLTVNWVDSIAMADMDVAGFREWSGSEQTSMEEAFGEFNGIAYDEFLDRLPGDCAVTGLTVVTEPSYISQDKTTKSYIPHDFVLTCATESGGEIRLAVCGTEEPLRDCYFVTDNPIESQVNGCPVTIYGFNTTFCVICTDGTFYYDIETTDVSLEDLSLLLSSLLQPK